ncbi:hypothetical protein LguiB_007028 [Lonicera macranthoides]
MSENHRHQNGFSRSGFSFSGNPSPVPESTHDNHQNGFSGTIIPSRENHPFQLDLNPNHYPQLPNNLNPSFPETLSDSMLESEFSRLSLSTLYPQQSQFTAPSNLSGGGSLIGDNNNPWIDSSSMDPRFSPVSYSLLQAEYDEYQKRLMELQWLRVQHAIMGQIGFDGASYGINNSDPNNPTFHNERRYNTEINNNRYPAPIRPLRNRNRSGSGSGSMIVQRVPRSGVNNGSGPVNSIGFYNGDVEPRPMVMKSLLELRGKMYLLTKNKTGCSYLVRKFEEGNPQEMEVFFGEVKDYIRDIMMDKDGSNMIQKFFDVCSDEHITQILSSVCSDEHCFTSICLDSNGTNMYGNHVIQKCLAKFSSDEIETLLNVIADNCVEIARDKSGCCVMQQCIYQAHRLCKDRLISQVVSNALLLADDPFGNYVVQFMTEMRIPQVNLRLMGELEGNYLALSMNKFGSNVVENCIIHCVDDCTRDRITRELIHSPPDFLMLAQHPYGNYVIQTALHFSKGGTKREMTRLIQVYHAFLQSHPHGKRVLDITRGRRPQPRFQPQQQQHRFIMP